MFFRKGTETGQRAPARSAETEAQLRELRVKARRRLIGALALVLVAVIVVPWLFDETPPGDPHPPIVVPAPAVRLPATSDPLATEFPAAPGTVRDPSSGGTVSSGNAVTTTAASGTSAQAQAPAQTSSQKPAAAQASTPAQSSAPSSTAVASSTTSTKPARTPSDASHDKPAATASQPPDRASTDKPAAGRTPTDRTDDGSVALALLAGKTPATASAKPKPAAAEGRYYLQVAAYTTEPDALARRDSLRQSGVSDAYVESGQSNGRTVYRLRVGPFGSHEAAQAAQTRLRALGYQNGLISGK